MEIGVDRDDVVFDYGSALVAFHNQRYPQLNLQFSDLTSFDLRDSLRLSFDEYPKFMSDFERIAYLNAPIFPKTYENLMKLIQQGHELSMITACSILHLESIQHLNSRFLQGIFNNVFFTQVDPEHPIPKSEICKKHNIELLIDDGIHNAADCFLANIKVLLMDKPWNQDYDCSKKGLSYRIYSLDEVITHPWIKNN